MRMTLEMSPLRIRSLLRRTRCRVAALAAFAVLTGAVAVHHAPSMDMDMHMASAGVCLAVLQIAVGAALVATARPAAGAGRVRLLPRRSVAVPEPTTVPARAGPRHLQVLRL